MLHPSPSTSLLLRKEFDSCKLYQAGLSLVEASLTDTKLFSEVEHKIYDIVHKEREGNPVLYCDFPKKFKPMVHLAYSTTFMAKLYVWLPSCMQKPEVQELDTHFVCIIKCTKKICDQIAINLLGSVDNVKQKDPLRKWYFEKGCKMEPNSRACNYVYFRAAKQDYYPEVLDNFCNQFLEMLEERAGFCCKW